VIILIIELMGSTIGKRNARVNGVIFMIHFTRVDDLAALSTVSDPPRHIKERPRKRYAGEGRRNAVVKGSSL
jgi:hypothetical protein